MSSSSAAAFSPHETKTNTFSDRQSQRSRAMTHLPPPVTLSMLTNYGIMDTSDQPKPTTTKGMNLDETDDDESDTDEQDTNTNVNDDKNKKVQSSTSTSTPASASGGFASGFRRRLRGKLNRSTSGRLPPRKPAGRPKSKSVAPPPPPRRAKSVYAIPRSKGNHNKPKPKPKPKHGYGINLNSKPKSKDDIDMDTNEKLLKVYNDYVREKGEKPGNTFDLINYVQFNGITGINFREIGKFLMTHKQ
eukprot:CAMPEP_0201566388 /NCGR_PEP_ID=MMETSP0190_2-20130828/6134_1 /ASSEMBLY_ACC=CAM_ASM_000263 /TAXON_ID=37353 /ORGANISM="Rosalina sp." /LENGTH=245 /DNA_ID=CAMNT_0047985027 /DNA_START=429 /DNA_END=1166 /DNA_ORIENTATION=-